MTELVTRKALYDPPAVIGGARENAVMKRLCSLSIALAAALVAAAPASAEMVSRSYPASDAEIVNPERGFWSFATNDFSKSSAGDLAYIRKQGLSLVYGIIRLDDFRSDPLPDALLARIDTSFERARKAKLKVIVRFVYNYPDNENEYQNAKDAPLDVVLGHIGQLKPVLARNADAIAVMQAGFIGAWGEGHTSSNKLTTPENKATIRDALLAALPAGRMLQWRYPGDVIGWAPEPPPAGDFARLGLHNDCFMSSKTDVGTYSSKENARERQRAYAAALSRATFYSGETCNVGSRTERLACDDIRREGPQFHVTALNGDYSPKFIKSWKAGGCYDEVRRSLGYRLMLRRAKAQNSAARGGIVKARLDVANEGWARISNPRPFRLVAAHRASGRTFTVETPGDIRSVEPEKGKATGFAFRWTVPGDAPAGVYDLFAALPDASAALAGDPAYAVRFANGSGADFGWDADAGRFALGLTVDVAE